MVVVVARPTRESRRIFGILGGIMEGKWIAVEESLPALHQTVLAYDKFYGKMKTAEMFKDGLCFDDGDDDCSITHWMELPSEPSREEVIAQREEITRAFIAKYGIEPDEIEQVKERGVYEIVWYVRRREARHTP
jgi:hypothetical protein